MKFLSLSFDDGFLKSSLTTAAIFEKHGLRAGFNVIASGHQPDFGFFDPKRPRGDFSLWNRLKQAGHEIMPHGYCHTNKAQLPLNESRALIEKCLRVFEKELQGFDRRQSVFAFPYNASTEALNDWLRTQVRAIRYNRDAAILNPPPSRAAFELATTGHGPDSCDAHLETSIQTLLSSDSAWLVYTLHGVDDEGWGPVSAKYLDDLLGRLNKVPGLTILPTGQALALHGN